MALIRVRWPQIAVLAQIVAVRFACLVADVADLIGSWLPAREGACEAEDGALAGVTSLAAGLVRLALADVLPALTAATANAVAAGENPDTVHSTRVQHLASLREQLLVPLGLLLADPIVVEALAAEPNEQPQQPRPQHPAAARSASASPDAAGLQRLLSNCHDLLEAAIEVRHCPETLPIASSLATSLSRLSNKLLKCDRCVAELRQAERGAEASAASPSGGVGRRQHAGGMAFRWVDASLVQALKSGEWVLLDNLNSAPPELVERLNSLLEDSPSLNVYEHADGEVFAAAAGTIHPRFRLFATVNPRRPLSHKLSSALYNRVIRICLAPLDAGLTPANAGSHELTALLRGRFAGLPGGAELAELSVRYHAAMLALVGTGAVQVLQDFRLTPRNLLQAAGPVAARCASIGSPVPPATSPGSAPAASGAAPHANPVQSLVLGLTRSYTSSVSCVTQRGVALQALAGALQHPSLRKPLYEVPTAPAADSGTALALEADVHRVSDAVAKLQQRAAAMLWSLLQRLEGVPSMAALAIMVSGCVQS